MDNLPVEILHRIFDFFDVQTLFFSIRPVCRYFQSTVHNYERLNFNFKFLWVYHFDILCRLVSPPNIRSLTLYSNELIPIRISSFLTQIQLRQLTKLHSIHLDGIEEFQFNYLCKRINLNLLRSFSIRLTKYDNRRRKTTTNFLSKIVQQSNLRTIEFNIENSRISHIEWPSNCSIQCLILHRDMNFENLVQIFSCSPQLHRLITKEKFSSLINSHQLTSSFPQLTSLIVEQLDVTIDQLEAFLSLTPSLIYLKLIGDCRIFDGKRWEAFIHANLPHLNQFEFEITCQKSMTQTIEDFHSFVQSYRSAFWIEHKKWFIWAEFDLDNRNNRISSLPMPDCSFEYDFNFRKVLLSTSNEICPIEKISQLNLLFQSVWNENIFWSIDFSLRNVTKLHLYFNGKLPLHCQKYLRNFVDISQLIEVKFENRFFFEDDEHYLSRLLTFLQEFPKLSSLILHIRYDQFQIYPHLTTMIELLPCQINHLQIPIEKTKQIEMLLKRCHHLSQVRFPVRNTQRSMEIKQWFERNTSDSIYRNSAGFDTIYIGKKTDEHNNFKYKRIKISEDFMES